MLKGVKIPDNLPVGTQDDNHIPHDIHWKAAGVPLGPRREDFFNVNQERHLAIGESLDGVMVK